jgi:hypothetical protein
VNFAKELEGFLGPTNKNILKDNQPSKTQRQQISTQTDIIDKINSSTNPDQAK